MPLPVYNAVASVASPTKQEGQATGLSTDLSGNLRVNFPPASSFAVVNLVPYIVQSVNVVTKAAATSISGAFANTTKGNTIVVLASGNSAGGTVPTDTQGNTYTLIQFAANGTVGSGIWIAVNIVGGPNTINSTGWTSNGIGLQIHEVYGALYSPNDGILATSGTAANFSNSFSTSPIQNNELIFSVIALASGTVTGSVQIGGAPLPTVNSTADANNLSVAGGGLGTFWTGHGTLSNWQVPAIVANYSGSVAYSTIHVGFKGIVTPTMNPCIGPTAGSGGGLISQAPMASNSMLIGGVYTPAVMRLFGNGQQAALQLDQIGSLWVSTENRRTTYRMAVKSFTPVASATSPTFSIQGSNSKTIRVLRLVITTSCLTGTGTPFKSDLVLQKFSVLTGGTTGSTPTGTVMDGNNTAQTAICLQYSAVPTTATAIGGLTAAELIQMLTPTVSVNATTRNEFTFGDKNGQGLVLRGTAQYLGITINPLGTTPLMSVWIEWVEDDS